MGPSESDNRCEVLVASATELVSLLREFQADPLADLVAHGLELVEAGDGHGLDRILALRGGMGSLNDLVIHPLNHHPITDANAEEVNDRLRTLRSTVFATALALQRELERPPG